MLKLTNLKIGLLSEKKEIIKGISLEFKPGEIHVLNGKNGSGKSTLVNSIIGNPNFEIKSGKIELIVDKIDELIINKLDNSQVKEENGRYIVDINETEPDIRSLLGIYLANQYPLEIPGVKLSSFLRLIYNSRRPKDKQLPVFKFKELLEKRAELINYPKELLSRNLNEGFSGGEKKKTEILQMLILEPSIILLDEIDSGLDKNSVKEVFEGLKAFINLHPDSIVVLITHYDRYKEYLKPTFEHEIENGFLIDTKKY